MQSHSQKLAAWTRKLKFEDVPGDVIEATRLRILDVIGLALAGLRTPFGRSILHACEAMNPPGPSRMLGSGRRMGVAAAAFANGALSQALEFDDTHNESIVHMSAPSVAAALAISEYRRVSGKELIAAVALGNEVSCRAGVVAPGQFHRRGFHPTGLFAPFGVTCLAGQLLSLSEQELTHACGMAGSFASGILQCWVDGTQSKFLHPGWAAQSGITAAFLGMAGTTGPVEVFEGRFGLFASHLQDEAATRRFERITEGLGRNWESRQASFKPYPAAHVLHPYIDALLRLRSVHAIDPGQVVDIVCPVAGYILPIVCEPVAEKRRPNSDSHGRVSLQYTLAEALYRGELGKDAYATSSLTHPGILRLADRVQYVVDPSFPGPERFKGAVKVTMESGQTYEAVEEHNRGSALNPMSREELYRKFRLNVAGVLNEAQTAGVIEAVANLESAPDASALVTLSAA